MSKTETDLYLKGREGDVSLSTHPGTVNQFREKGGVETNGSSCRPDVRHLSRGDSELLSQRGGEVGEEMFHHTFRRKPTLFYTGLPTPRLEVSDQIHNTEKTIRGSYTCNLKNSRTEDGTFQVSCPS